MTSGKRRRQRSGPSPSQITAVLGPVQEEVSALSTRVALLSGMLRHRGVAEYQGEAERVLAETRRLRAKLVGVRKTVPMEVGASSRFDDLLKSIERLSRMVAARRTEPPGQEQHLLGNPARLRTGFSGPPQQQS